jgi:hypothetical protein
LLEIGMKTVVRGSSRGTGCDRTLAFVRRVAKFGANRTIQQIAAGINCGAFLERRPPEFALKFGEIDAAALEYL